MTFEVDCLPLHKRGLIVIRTKGDASEDTLNTISRRLSEVKYGGLCMIVPHDWTVETASEEELRFMRDQINRLLPT